MWKDLVQDNEIKTMRWILIAGIIMLIVGAVYWASGEYDENLGCSLQRTLDNASGLFTPSEVVIRFDACIANAQAKVRWSRPVCGIGTALTIFGFFTWIGSKLASKDQSHKS